MTIKDYSAIQRQLGIIEGAVIDCESLIYDVICGAVNAIDEILKNEKIGDNNETI